MIVGILSLIESANSIYVLPYVNMIIVGTQIIIFIRNAYINYQKIRRLNDAEKLTNHFISLLVFIASLLLYLFINWIASPALTAISIIASMICFSQITDADTTSLINVIALVFIGSILQFINPACSSPNMLYSFYSTISHTNLLSSLYTNIKIKSIVESNEDIFNYDTVFYYASQCLVTLSWNMSNAKKMFTTATFLITAHVQMRHAYAEKRMPPLFWREKFTDSCFWMTARSFELLVKSSPLKSIFSNEAIKLGSAVVSCVVEPKLSDQSGYPQKTD